MKLKYKFLIGIILIFCFFLIDENKVNASDIVLTDENDSIITSAINLHSDRKCCVYEYNNELYAIFGTYNNKTGFCILDGAEGTDTFSLTSCEFPCFCGYLRGIYVHKYNFNSLVWDWVGELSYNTIYPYQYRTVSQLLNSIVFSNVDVYYASNSTVAFTAGFNDNFSNSFTPVLDSLEFVSDLNGYHIVTNKLNQVDYVNCELYLYNTSSLEFESCVSYQKLVEASTPSYIRFYYDNIKSNTSYIFKLYDTVSHKFSNSLSLYVSSLDYASKLYYDITAPTFEYDYISNIAYVYTNYLDVKYYDIVSLYYYKNTNNGDYSDWTYFPISICKKEYNSDNTQFRFVLSFTEPCKYTVRYVIHSNDYSLQYSLSSTFNLTQEYFDTNGYEEDNSLLGRIGNWLTNFFKGIFIPPDNYFETKISSLGDKLNAKVPYQQYLDDFKQLEDIEAKDNNITVSADLAGYYISDNLTIDKTKFIDFSMFSKYKEIWFSWIRVFTYIGLIIYNINMLMKFLRGMNIADGTYRAVESIVNSVDKQVGPIEHNISKRVNFK